MSRLLSRTRLCGIVLLLTAVSCGEDDQPLTAIGQEIREATRDETSTEVAPLADGSGVFCTGILVAPAVALTAGHCLSHRGVSILTGPEGRMVPGPPVVAVRSHPRFGAASDGDDIGVLALAEPIDSAPTTLAVATPPSGSAVLIVGYGRSDPSGGAGVRRAGRARIGRVDPGTFDLEPDPATACYGDSGGAVFDDSVCPRALIGVISRGDADCATITRVTRVDREREPFIDRLLADMRAGGSGVGQRCYRDDQCATGLCTDQGGSTGFRFCSRPCGRNSQCGGGTICGNDGPGSRCLFATRPPGSIGSACRDDLDCARGHCRHSLDGGVCTESCLPGPGGGCPAGSRCVEASSRDPGLFYECVPLAAAACAISPTPARGAPVDLAALLIVVAIGRRARQRATSRLPSKSAVVANIGNLEP